MITASLGPGNHPGKAGPLPFPSSIRRILCPTDLSDESDTAFAHACLIAERFDAELTRSVGFPRPSSPRSRGRRK